jgi:hypothetical protein
LSQCPELSLQIEASVLDLHHFGIILVVEKKHQPWCKDLGWNSGLPTTVVAWINSVVMGSSDFLLSKLHFLLFCFDFF